MPLSHPSSTSEENSNKVPNIQICKGNIPFSVNLSIDLEEYCTAARILQDHHLNVNGFDKETYEAGLIEKSGAFYSIKENYAQLLKGTIGSHSWYETLRVLRQEIIELLRNKSNINLSEVSKSNTIWNRFLKSFNKDSYEQQDVVEQSKILLDIINDYLDDKSEDKSKILVFESLQNDLIELIKNSIDALVKSFKNHKTEQTFLTLTLQVIPNEDDLSIRVSDNAGGFNEDLLHALQVKLRLPEYPMKNIKNDMLTEEDKEYFTGGLVKTIKSDKITKEDEEYYTGGQGFGLTRIFSLIINGKIIEGGFTKHLYDTKGKTSVMVDNVSNEQGDTIGAMLTITTPYDPFPLISESQEDEKLSRSLHELTSPSAFFSSMEWKQRHQKHNSTPSKCSNPPTPMEQENLPKLSAF